MDTLSEFTRRLQGTKDDPTLIFEREYATTPQDLWEAVTDPERLSRWFGTFLSQAPQSVGDTFNVNLGGGAGDLAQGTVLECEAPRRLAYQWQWQKERPSTVSAELEPRDSSTLLRVTHAQVEPRNAIGYGGGWEQVMLGLDDELTGTSTYAPPFEAHEEAAHQAWRELLG